LDYLEDKIVHPDFFRINRGAILRKDQIRRFQVQTYSSGEVETNLNETMTVSRSRLQDFKQWFFGS
jgi:DNA-binding LytR/AlgR family response regulator